MRVKDLSAQQAKEDAANERARQAAAAQQYTPPPAPEAPAPEQPKKSAALPIALGIASVVAFPVVGPAAAIALGAGALISAFKGKAPPEETPTPALSGYHRKARSQRSTLHGYLSGEEMVRWIEKC